MTLRTLLNQPVTIQRRGVTGTDPDYGTDVYGTTEVEAEGYVEQTAATEITVDRETYVSNWLVVLMGDVELDGNDRIVYGDSTFEVVGSPHRVWNPRTRQTHHVEARCVETTG